MAFVSKSQERRFNSQMKDKLSKIANMRTCVHFQTPSDQPFRSNQIACGKPVRSGFLCEEHQKAEELNWIARNRHRAKDQDPYIVADIIATEKRELAAGRLIAVRFGAIDPLYVCYWER